MSERPERRAPQAALEDLDDLASPPQPLSPHIMEGIRTIAIGANIHASGQPPHSPSLPQPKRSLNIIGVPLQAEFVHFQADNFVPNMVRRLGVSCPPPMIRNNYHQPQQLVIDTIPHHHVNSTREKEHGDMHDITDKLTINTPSTSTGMDCYADDRDALGDFERFYNNSHFSDVTLIVGDEMFYAHRLILIKNSEVFERMLSEQWNGQRKARDYRLEIELVEDRVCGKVFPFFLRFLYCNHIVLHTENTLPILILADKYNVASLRKVCLDYAVNHIIPLLSLKDIFHIWFQYGTKCFHQPLISECISVLSDCFQDLISSPEWEKEWLSIDRDQLCEFLKCSHLTVANEFEIWQAVQKWIQAPSHPERRGRDLDKHLSQILALIRFPFMTPDELNQVERSSLVETYSKNFLPHIMLAYKFQALPLVSRVGCREFTGTQFLLRNYTELRWDKRLVIPNISSLDQYTEVTLKIATRASALPPQTWDWELKIHPKGFSSANDDFRCILSSNVILDQTRAVEYLLSVVDDKKVLRSVAGRKTFSKTRYSADLEMEKRLNLQELLQEDSPFLVNDDLYLQLVLKPID